MSIATDLGSQIKEIRKNKGLKLKELADLTGLSTAYLSNVERNQTSPTLANLFKIGTALEVDLLATMESTPIHQGIVVKKDDRKRLFSTKSKITYESITESSHNITGVCITIDGNCIDEIVTTGHTDRDELGLITKGSMTLYLNDTEYKLSEGDSIYIERNTPHSYKRTGEGECISYWFYTKDNGPKAGI